MHAHSLYEDDLIFCLTRLTTKLSTQTRTNAHTHQPECVGPVAAARAHIVREQEKRNQKSLNAK